MFPKSYNSWQSEGARPGWQVGGLPLSSCVRSRTVGERGMAHARVMANEPSTIFMNGGFTMTKANATKPQDAITLLKSQHDEVKAMFKQFDELGERATTSKKKLATEICEQLIMHTAIEEEIFYPALRETSKEMEDMLDEAFVEHASAKDLIAQVQEMEPGDDLYDAKVTVLGEYVAHHVEEEEEEMFPKVRKLKLDLDALGAEMAARRDELLASA